MSQEYCYLNIPVPFFRLLFTERDAVDMLIRYGVCGSAVTLKLVDSQMFRYISVGLLVRNNLTKELKEAFHDIDLSRNGFSGDGTNMDTSEAEDRIATICCNDKNLKEECCIWYRVSRAIDLYGDTSMFFIIDEMCLIYKHVLQLKGSPFASVRKDILYDYAKGYRNTEENRVSLAMYLGIKSIVGKNDVFRTTAKMIQARMVGAINEAECQTILSGNPSLKQIYDIWTTRRRYTRLLKDLMARKLIFERWDGNKMAVSCSLSDEKFEEGLRRLKDHDVECNEINNRKGAIKKTEDT